MRRWLGVAAVAWLILLGSAWAARAAGVRGLGPAVAYFAASLVCHQRADRSFVSAGVQWPVCGRCAGLYLAAPFGAMAALCRRRRLPDAAWWLMAAALPTVVSLGVEWSGTATVTTLHRAVAALPLGAMLAAVLVDAAPASLRRQVP